MIIFQTLCRAVSVGESLQRIELRHTRWDDWQSKLFFRWDQPPRNFHRLDDNLPRAAGDLCKDLKQGREAFWCPWQTTWRHRSRAVQGVLDLFAVLMTALLSHRNSKLWISLSCCQNREAMCIINIIISFSSVKHLKQRIYNLLFRMWT